MNMRAKRGILTAIGGLLLLLTFGIVGGMELETIPAGRGLIEGLACMVAAWVCFRRAGCLWDGCVGREKRE